MNRIDLSTTIALFESMDCVEEMSEVNAEEEEEDQDEEDGEETSPRHSNSIGQGEDCFVFPLPTRFPLDRSHRWNSNSIPATPYLCLEVND